MNCRLHLLVFALALVGVPLHLYAAYDPDDALTSYVEAAVRQDSNVFNTSTSSPGDARPQDSLVFDTRAFLHYHYRLSRQRVYVETTLSRSDYARFSTVNYNGWRHVAGWEWALGNDLQGVVGYTDSRSLSEFNQLALGPGDLSRGKTLQSTTQYSLYHNVQLQLTTSHQTNEHTQLDYLDLDASGRGVAMLVSLDKGSSATLRYDDVDVAFSQDFLSLSAAQRGYDQRTLMLTVDYPVGDALAVSANVSTASVKQKSDGSCVSNSLSGGEVRWQASRKLRLVATYQRKYDAPGTDTSATLSNSVTGRLEWQHSPKLRFAAQKYASTTAYAAESEGGERHERVISDRIEAGWTPANALAVTLYGQHVSRHSPLARSTFQQNQLGATVRVNY